ncbi:hypothetical protein [Microcoleus sp.]|uniref:hypothetical protein n=1 Tax=Microcoleus sp. TaxID=44472 RepID=UPI0035930E6B
MSTTSCNVLSVYNLTGPEQQRGTENALPPPFQQGDARFFNEVSCVPRILQLGNGTRIENLIT